ncbi:hypothetical protein V8C35DRAFT_306187 [Trichoderma chlorosporum]
MILGVLFLASMGLGCAEVACDNGRRNCLEYQCRCQAAIPGALIAISPACTSSCCLSVFYRKIKHCVNALKWHLGCVKLPCHCLLALH